jgi:hypothetical protein
MRHGALELQEFAHPQRYKGACPRGRVARSTTLAIVVGGLADSIYAGLRLEPFSPDDQPRSPVRNHLCALVDAARDHDFAPALANSLTDVRHDRRNPGDHRRDFRISRHR